MEKTDHSLEVTSSPLSTKDIQRKQEEMLSEVMSATVEKHLHSAAVQAVFVGTGLDESDQKQILRAGLSELLRRSGSETFAEQSGALAHFSEASVLKKINHSGLIEFSALQKAHRAG